MQDSPWTASSARRPGRLSDCNMDPILEETSDHEHHKLVTARRRRDRVLRKKRRQTKFERWAWTEIPAYRLGLLLSYTFAVYFGVSALLAGVPAFNLAAPEGWTPVWASLLTLAGPVGLIGIGRDSHAFHKVELVASAVLSTTLVTYAGTMLVLAYWTGDINRVAAGAGFAWLATGPLIRMFWLIQKVLSHRKLSKTKE